ncbi:related to Topoisomerase 1-associated factor 1 [Cephalotrichum gorgonifer]|uniref:Topoisomerase 1-associated factor 1 n=1 Tax=Cephalotrichum gorgonifer TaxID=2041049 RepID=A0AAE8MUA8_9PEZI|nr:related to Topoisomerase 1-associated factor 1 [Cephalotrichum gorgonifer]
MNEEVQAHVNSLVSALGGTSADDDGRYVLGDDALDVLRDLKKWIRFYDEKMNRMDVARCIADSNIVDVDLLHILAMWTEGESDSKFKSRLALACLEVMVPLTWPFDKDPERLTVNNYRNMPVLELAQVRYKRAIINYDAARILHTAVRLALPSMAMPIGDRGARDQGIIKLILYFLRNTAMIAPPPGVKFDGDESQISRSALIDAFSYQDIFLFLLTIASNMGEDFRTEDVVVMEILFHLLKRVDADRLFLSEKQQGKAKADQLVAMMRKEEAMHNAYNKHAPTRHNRFGTTIWVKRDDGKMSTISGQGPLMDVAARRRKLDETKSFKPPKYRRKNEVDSSELGLAPKLNSRATEQLRSFVEEFLDSGFNPLFQHIRKTIDRDAQHALHYHPRQFFYLVAWFLRAERARQDAKSKRDKNGDGSGNGEDVSPFNLVAGVLNQEMFITLQKSMRSALDNKSWEDLIAVMRCFTQILLTVQEMTGSGNETDEEIADNILSRLFYEDTVHDLVTGVIRNYNHQGFEFLDAATELTHHFIRILEAYSKRNVDMQIRSRRRARKAKRNASKGGNEDGDDADGLGGSEDDEQQAQKTVSERKFDFESFAQRFVQQGVVDTFVEYLKHYKELDDEQLKRAHRYFYRLAFKQNKAVMIFRVDIIHLLYNMIKGPEALDRSSGLYKDWEELIKQVLKKCIRKIQERPALIVEMLFSKNNEIAHYIETGTEREAKPARVRPAAELEFRNTEELDKQIGIVVGALLDRNEIDHISWVKGVLRGAEETRKEWPAAESAIPSVEGGAEATVDGVNGETSGPREPKEALPYTVRADNEARHTAMLKNPYLRLLMATVGIRRLSPALEETLESVWIIPAEVTADQLKEYTDLINAAEFNPPMFEEGAAEDQIRRKTNRTRAFVPSDDEDEDLDNLFPEGGPTERRAIDGAKPKKAKRSRRRRERSQSPDEAELDERARKRREKERERRAKVKSQLYVHDSDEDSEADREFFAKEEELRRSNQRLAEAAGQSVPTIVSVEKKRKPAVLVDSEDEMEFSQGVTSDEGKGVDSPPGSGSEAEGSGSDNSEPGVGRRKRRRISEDPEDGVIGDDNDDADRLVWPSSKGVAPDEAKTDADGDIGMGDTEKGDGDEDEDDEPVRSARPRARVRGGFVIDSSDEE